MTTPLIKPPDPYLFKGGSAADYKVFVGESGTWCTRHIKSNQVIQSVQPNSGLTEPMLQLAGLGLGLLNIGVGIYNAYKIHKAHEDVKLQRQEMHNGFHNIHTVLSAQHRTLELLVSKQDNLAHRMDTLRQEMHVGFQKVLAEFQDAEARRRREEFETHTFKVLKAYERFGNMLPNLSEADRLIDRAEELEAWLRTQLNQIEMGQPERLPLLVVLAFSVRAKVDAFAVKGGPYSDFAVKELKDLKHGLCHEAYSFCEGRSLYALGVEMPEILSQYVLLKRGVHQGLALQSATAPQVIFDADQLTWDDGLDQLRQIFSSGQEKNEQTRKMKGTNNVKLETIPDYDWYIRFAGQNKATFNVHSRTTLPLSNVLYVVGHPKPQEGEILRSDLETLKHFSLPESPNKVAIHLQDEFSWGNAPLLKHKLPQRWI